MLQTVHLQPLAMAAQGIAVREHAAGKVHNVAAV